MTKVAAIKERVKYFSADVNIILNIFSALNYDISLSVFSTALVFFDHSGDIINICGFNPHRSQDIYMDYVSTVVKKDKCHTTGCEKYHNSTQKICIIL